MPPSNYWLFLRNFLRTPRAVGAVAPSSPALGRGLCEAYVRGRSPARVLEVGAGTGAVTRCIVRVLRAEDELDVCEINPQFVDVLQRWMSSDVPSAELLRTGRLRLIGSAVQEIEDAARYDFIICALPLTRFELPEARAAMTTMSELLKPGGVMSYFEYLYARPLMRRLAFMDRKAAIHAVSAYMDEQIHRYQYATRVVMGNFPPARVRHLRFASGMPGADERVRRDEPSDGGSSGGHRRGSPSPFGTAGNTG